MTGAGTVFLVGDGIVAGRVGRLLHGRNVEQLNARNPDHRRVAGGDIAVLAHAGEHARLAARALERGAHVVSVGDGVADTRAQLALAELAGQTGCTLVVGAAMAPGLAGLIARHLAGALNSIDELHVAVHGTAGPACARAHHVSLRRPALGWHDGRWIEHVGGSGRELCWFPEPIGARDCYRGAHAGPIVLQRAFPEVDRISMRRSATRRDRLTARLPMLRAPHAEGGVGALRVEVRGADATGARTCLVAGIAELVGTAAGACVAAFVDLLRSDEFAPGLAVPGSAKLPTLALLRRLEHYGVRLQEFTGIPTRS